MIYREDFTLPSEFLEQVSQQEITEINIQGQCSVNGKASRRNVREFFYRSFDIWIDSVLEHNYNTFTSLEVNDGNYY